MPARPETLPSQIDEVMGFPTDPAVTHSSFNALDPPEVLDESDPDAERDTQDDPASLPPALAIANSLFPDDDLAVHDAYLATLAEQYGAGLIPVDYADPEQASGFINDWVTRRPVGGSAGCLTGWILRPGWCWPMPCT